MTRAELDRIAWHCVVKRCRACSRRFCSRFLKRLDLCGSGILEDIQFLTEFSLQLRSHCPELIEKSCYLTFLTEKTHTRRLDLLLCLA